MWLFDVGSGTQVLRAAWPALLPAEPSQRPLKLGCFIASHHASIMMENSALQKERGFLKGRLAFAHCKASAHHTRKSRSTEQSSLSDLSGERNGKGENAVLEFAYKS